MRWLERSAILLVLLAVIACDAARAAKDALTRATPPPASLRLQDGDLVFQESRSTQSAAIIAATHSHWTHMGIVLIDDGKAVVLEAVQPT